MKTGIIVILIFLNVCISCTYQRPLLSIRKSSKTIIDSDRKRTIKQKAYLGISFRTYSVNAIGYAKRIEFDSLGNKIEVRKWKQTPLDPMNAEYARSCSKLVFYSSTGDIESISKHISVSRGQAGRHKNIIIDFQNGKRIKSVYK
jgi:hypothetical protein